MPPDLVASAKKRREALLEMVAETNESLMEKFLESGDLSDVELRSGLAQAVATGQIVPIACVSATKMVGLRALTHLLAQSCPPREDRGVPPMEQC